LGFTGDDVAACLDIEVWPDVWPALTLFIDVLTQWRMSMNGVTGLDYTALAAVMGIRGIADADRGALFDDIRIMESAALAHMRRPK
jgi:hypothetical protein